MDEWNKGYPSKEGWYDCLVGGEVKRLKHWICHINGKHRWLEPDGYYVKEIVLWRGETNEQ